MWKSRISREKIPVADYIGRSSSFKSPDRRLAVDVPDAPEGEWQIADTCPKLTEALPSRIHDDKRPAVAADPLHDVANDAR